MKTDLLDIRLCDNMALMAEYPDKWFDLCICDPPYGIGADKAQNSGGEKWGYKKYKDTDWDKAIPSDLYFAELFRVSKNQIIWGANYMTWHLPPSMGWIFWDKGQRDFSLADGELAFSSFNKALRVCEVSRGASLAEGVRIHPTQKPIALYRWLLANYAKSGQKILDTHLGSGSIAIACHYAGNPLVACEIDEDYYAAACERIERETRQTDMFTSPPIPREEETTLLL